LKTPALLSHAALFRPLLSMKSLKLQWRRRLELLEEAEHYVDELIAEVGAPTAAEAARADAIVQSLERHPERHTRHPDRRTG
jgi:hypothetical protein